MIELLNANSGSRRRFDYRQQIDKPGDHGVKRGAEIGKIHSQLFQPRLFIGRINDDRITGRCEGIDERFGELTTWIVDAIGEEFLVAQHAIAIDRMK